MKKRQGRAAKKVSSPSRITPSIPLSLPSYIGKGEGIFVILVGGSGIVIKELKEILVKAARPLPVGIEDPIYKTSPDWSRRDFDQFWQKYPNKAHKQHSFKTFLAVRASGVTINQIAAVLIEKIKAGASMPPAYRFLRAIKK